MPRTDRRFITIPAARVAQANAILERLGYGSGNFAIPLGDGATPTRYGCDLPLLGNELQGVLAALGKVIAAGNIKEYSGADHKERMRKCEQAESVKRKTRDGTEARSTGGR